MGELTPFLRRILKRVGKDLVHVTGFNGYASIRACNAIEPNTGSFPFTYPQSQNAYSTLKPAVALFDFTTPWRKVSRAAARTRPWPQFFFCHHPVTLALVIRREALPLPLVSYEQATAEVGILPMKIPIVECWHPGPIPFGAIDRVMIIRRCPQRVRTLPPGANELSCSNIYEMLWPRLPYPLTAEEEHTQMLVDHFASSPDDVIADILERGRQYDERKRLSLVDHGERIS
jgi:hypothetical protein